MCIYGVRDMNSSSLLLCSIDTQRHPSGTRAPKPFALGFFGLSPADFGKSPWKLNRVKIAPKHLFRPKVKMDKTFALANIF